MRLRSLSNCDRLKKRFAPQKNFELGFVTSAFFKAFSSTPFTPLNLIEWTEIIPVSRHADAATTIAQRKMHAQKRPSITRVIVQTTCHRQLSVIQSSGVSHQPHPSFAVVEVASSGGVKKGIEDDYSGSVCSFMTELSSAPTSIASPET